MGGYFSSSVPVPRVIRKRDARPETCIVTCDAMPEIGITTAEQALDYALYFARLARTYDEAPRGSALACSDTCFRSMAVCVVWLLWKEAYKTPEAAQSAVRRQRHVADVNCMGLYRPAIVLAVTMLQQSLEV
jgi:hypothetical protein